MKYMIKCVSCGKVSSYVSSINYQIGDIVRNKCCQCGRNDALVLQRLKTNPEVTRGYRNG